MTRENDKKIMTYDEAYSIVLANLLTDCLWVIKSEAFYIAKQKLIDNAKVCETRFWDRVNLEKKKAKEAEYWATVNEQRNANFNAYYKGEKVKEYAGKSAKKISCSFSVPIVLFVSLTVARKGTSSDSFCAFA